MYDIVKAKWKGKKYLFIVMIYARCHKSKKSITYNRFDFEKIEYPRGDSNP